MRNVIKWIIDRRFQGHIKKIKYLDNIERVKCFCDQTLNQQHIENCELYLPAFKKVEEEFKLINVKHYIKTEL